MENDPFAQALQQMESEIPATQAPAEGAVPQTPDTSHLAPTQATDGLPDLGVLNSPVRAAAAAGGGIWKSIFETKDFFTGEPAEADKSDFRRRVEGTQRRLEAASPVYGVVGSVSQFAAGMAGLGKVLKGGQALRIGGSLLAPSTTAGKVALESAKAATVGAIAFDPWEARLSNIVEQYPSLSNPVTRFLSAKPDDTAAEARLKSAIESLGMDAAILAAFKGFKMLKAGDREGAVKELEKIKVPEEAPPPEAPPSAPMSAQTANKGEAAAGVPANENPAQVPLQTPANSNTGELGLPAPANDAGASPAPLAQGNLAASGERPTQMPPVDGFQSDVGIRTGDPSAPGAANAGTPTTQPGAPVADVGVRQGVTAPEGAANVNLPPNDAPPAKGGLANDNVGFTQLFEQATAERAAARLPEAQATTEMAPAKAAGEAVPGMELRRVDNLTQSGVPKPTAPKVAVPDEAATEALHQSLTKDVQALEKYGSREAAEEAGHKFAPGEHIPWQKLNTPEDLNAFIARAAQSMESDLNAAKGGAVLSDAKLGRLVDQRVTAYGDNPEDVLAIFEKAGSNARTLAANMEAADAVAVKLADEAYSVALKIEQGQLGEWGGDRAAAMAEFAKRTGLAMTTFGHARSMLSNAARTMRRARGDLPRLSFDEIKQLQSLDPEDMLRIVTGTKGDASALKDALSKPGLLARVQDGATYLMVNNLLWGWKTHVVNATTNAYMLAARPGEKLIGATIMRAGGAGAEANIVQQRALYEYRSMGATLSDAWHSALDAFQKGDSIIDPHRVESMSLLRENPISGPALGWKPVQNVGDVAHNAIVSVVQAIGLPTRALGVADEFVKQIRYRSVVLADAQMEADRMGLAGVARKQLVTQRLNEAFDASGAATNMAALQEARIATFQQELLPGTFGRTMQGAVANYPVARFVVPFVKTPTNVLRYSQRYTPGLNMLQTDFREALTGKQGVEAQAQAAGQLSIGALATAYAAYLVADGRFTGSGPKDPKARSQLLATGWQPNSIVIQKDDGSVDYYPLGRFDPFGMLFGIVADTMDVVQHPDRVDEADSLGMATILAVSKQITDRTYLMNLNQFFQAMSDPDTYGPRFVYNTVGNMVPASSGLRAYVNQDPYMREVRSLADAVMARVPGLSDTLPARYDAFGDPITVRKGLASTVEDNVVDQEMIRMGEERGKGIIVPPSPTKDGHDLRDLRIEDGRTAYEALQVLTGHPPGAPSLKSSLARLIETDAYQKAPDGDNTTLGTKQWMLSGVTSKYRQLGERQLQTQSAIYRQALQENVLKVKAAYDGTQQTAKGPMERLQDLGAAFGLKIGQ